MRLSNRNSNKSITCLKNFINYSDFLKIIQLLLRVSFIFIIVLIIFCKQIKAQQAIQGINIAAPVVPYTTSDIFPTHDAKYGKGGFRSVSDTAERNRISVDRRDTGMIVCVLHDPSGGIKHYQLKGGITNANWIEEAGKSQLSDSDNDTWLSVEKSNDEDRIRFATNGNERILIDSNGNVGISTLSPNSSFFINGSVGKKVKTITASDTLDIEDNIILTNTSSVITINLPRASTCRGRIYIIKNIGSSATIVEPYGNESIEGQVNTSLAPATKECKTILSDGNNWFIMSSN